MAPSSASWPRVAETVDWLISVSSIGRAPMRRNSARSCASEIEKLPEICAPGPAVDTARVLDEVDNRLRDDLAVEDDRKRVRVLRCVLGRELRGLHSERRVCALLPALGDALGDLRERLAALVREVEGDVGRIRNLVELLLGVADVVARELRAVLHEVVPADSGRGLVGFGRRVIRRRLLAQDDIALGHGLRPPSPPAARRRT